MTIGSAYRGCLLGGAVGDALGAPVELMNIGQIQSRFGFGGIRDLVPAYGGIGAITDDTQMTLFTAEGLLRAHVRSIAKGICHPPAIVHHAYMRWLKTQGQTSTKLVFGVSMDGWLIGVPALWSVRGPGKTCLSALSGASQLGEPAANNSKGCGGVMRVAPVGLMADRETAFTLGVQTAALTHGHPTGYLSAGFLALLIAEIVAGASLRDAIETAKLRLQKQPDHDEVLNAITRAQTAASLGGLGEGWVAHEALAIALHCSLVTPNLEEAVVLAVNHSGDSDSTGAITGNICGALYGAAAIPERWLSSLELREEITVIADDLLARREGKMNEVTDSLWERYPGS